MAVVDEDVFHCLRDMCLLWFQGAHLAEQAERIMGKRRMDSSNMSGNVKGTSK